MRYRDFQNFRATPLWILIFANILIFIATSIASQSQFLSNNIYMQWGIARSTFSSQPWTIVTSMFLHDGIYHILGNMLMLYIYGTTLVQIIGEGKFLAVYFIGGIIGNVFFMLMSHGVAVGASGAIFALGGALAMLRPRIRVVLFPIPIPMDLWVYVILGFVLISFVGGVAWQAHLGGLLTGLAAGYYFKRWERSRGIYR